MDEYSLIEHSDFWQIPLGGKPVCRFTIDSEAKLDFFEPLSEEITVILKGEFNLEIGGKRYDLDAEKPTEIGPLFGVYRKIIRIAKAFKSGLLEISFLDGTTLSAPPDRNRQYESWEIVGAHYLRLVCLPSGGLMVWSPDKRNWSERE